MENIKLITISKLHKTTILLFMLLLATLSSMAQEETWKIDLNHSNVTFEISYFKVGQIKGSFDTYSGNFIEKNGVLSEINVSLKTASINTNQTDRDQHLRSKDFFDATKYPEIQFTSAKITKTSDTEYTAVGELTMSGITQEVTLKISNNGSYVHPRFKTTNRFYTITGSISREDSKVGTNYAPAKFALGKTVELISEIQIVKAQ